jgi:hypothetical protein
VAQKPAVVYLAQSRRNPSKKSLSPLHSSLALSVSFKICSAPRERVLRAVITPQRSGSCSTEPLLQQKHRMLLPNQNRPATALRGKQVTCRARMLLVRIAPLNGNSLNHLIQPVHDQTNPRPSLSHATPRSIFNRFLSLER